MDAKRKIELSKIVVTREIPLLAPILAELRIREVEGLGTMGVSFKNKEIAYDPEFINNINDKDIVFALAHELMHYALYHDAEAVRDKRYLIALNYATDSIINYILLNKLKFETNIECVTFETIRKLSKTLAKYKDEELIQMTHIEIARELIKDIEDFLNEVSQIIINEYNNSSGEDRGSSDDNDGNHSDDTTNTSDDSKGRDDKKSEQEGDLDNKLDSVIYKHFSDRLNDREKKALRESIKEILRREKEKLSKEEVNNLRRLIEKGKLLEKELKQRGEDFVGISDIIDIILRKKNRNWRKILRETFSEIRTIAKDYEYTRPSRKVWILKREFRINTFIPNIKKESEMVNVIVGIDVSGSISDKEYEEFVNEIYTLATDVKVNGWIVMWESEVTKVIEMKNGWNKKVFNELRERKGYGGTTIKSFFDKAKELAKNKRNTYLIILTDGYTENVRKEWVREWKKVVFITQSKESLKEVEDMGNVEIAYYNV